MKLLKKIFKKLCFELKMLWLDFKWWKKGARYSEPFAPSFYYRNSPETIRLAEEKLWEQREKEYQEIMEKINAYRQRHNKSAETAKNN